MKKRDYLIMVLKLIAIYLKGNKKSFYLYHMQKYIPDGLKTYIWISN